MQKIEEVKKLKILVVYHSVYGHVHKMAEAIVKGALKVEGAKVILRRVDETLSDEALKKMGVLEIKKQLSKIPICTLEDLSEADAIVFGTPTRYGNMSGQMRQFLDSTAKLWLEGSLIGKPGGVFTSTATQHGGQESTILGFHVTLLHLGMVIVGLPYSFPGQMRTDEITGGSPYGASTIAGTKGERMPSENELDAAMFQGEHIAKIAAKLKERKT